MKHMKHIKRIYSGCYVNSVKDYIYESFTLLTCPLLFSTFKYTQYSKYILQCQCWAVPMIFMKKTAYFQQLKKTGHGRTDGPTDHPMTDMTSYSDARTHLKTTPQKRQVRVTLMKPIGTDEQAGRQTSL